MTNTERRNALNRARAEALRHATWAEEYFDPEEGSVVCRRHLEISAMWSQVAQALKDGDPTHDSADNAPASQFTIPDTITR